MLRPTSRHLDLWGNRPQHGGLSFSGGVLEHRCWKRSLLLAIASFFVLGISLQCGCEQLGLTYVGKDGSAASDSSGSDSSTATDPENKTAGSGNSGSISPGNSENTGSPSGNGLGNGGLVNGGPLTGSASGVTAHRPLMVGSFNIQRFGETKSNKFGVMNQIQEIVFPYDLIAIQEIVSKKKTVLDNFVADLNRSKQATFSYVASPWLGESGHVEQYAFVYDATRLKVLGEPFVVKFPEKKMSREPLVCRFQVRSSLTGNQKPFSFAVVNVHAKPEEPDAVQEMSVVASVVSFVKQQLPEEDDILVMGDFNLSPDKIFQKTDFQKLDGWKAVLKSAVKTNVAETKSFDNILFSEASTAEYQRKSGVINMQQKFTIDKAGAKEISDHRPIWAVFSLTESMTKTAANPASKPVF